MKAAIEALIRGLPLDERARRILDETLLDWTIEADASWSFGGRIWVGARSVVSIVRVLAVVSVRGATALPIAWLAGRMVLFGLLPSLAFTIAIDARLPGVVAQLPVWQRSGYELYLAMAMLTATPLYVAALFGTAMLQTFLIGAAARHGWLPPTSILSSILRVPAGWAAIVIGSLWRARRLRAGGDEGVCLRTGNDVDRPPTQAGA